MSPKTTKSSSSRWGFIALAFAVFFFIRYIPLSEELRFFGGAELTVMGQTAIGILMFSLILWMSETIPFHLTGMIGIVLMALFQVDTFKNIIRVGFGNHTVAFFIGVLILSAFITMSGLGKRIAMYILSKTGNNTRNIILGFLVTGLVLSMWITDMAVAAMLMPLAHAIVKEEGCEPLKSNFAKALLISTAWGPLIGGIGTPAGCSVNPIAIGFLQDVAGIAIGFPEWMSYGVPAAVILIPIAWLVLITVFKPEISHLSKSKEELKKEFQELAPMGREEKITALVFALTAILWLTTPWLQKIFGISIPVSMPVFLTGTLFFLPGMSSIPWRKIEKEINWSSIILVLTGIALGMMLYQTGAAKWIAMLLFGKIASLPTLVTIFLIVFLVSLLKVALSSNAVTGTIIIPIMIELAKGFGLDPLAIVIPAAITANIAFILVTSTPATVISYSAGYFSISDMAKVGVIMTIFSSIAVALVLFFIGQFTGIY
ncbi:MAG: DASS family sodium-coupled anion symporter [Spirochaetales bacterium]|uniref:DASS family sodium-coupled anion symporter n=1 Tax=Candidatus Thalassospirochaeta sargassi TaxID=3119039 RepID=A0AAJ1ICW7_9SPIO|nr:DASS family sodium-coupled anion symporter [Spirochaetales bacterium]